MAAIKLLLGVFYFVATGSVNNSKRDLLIPKHRDKQQEINTIGKIRQSIVRRARLEIGVREKTGKNDGARVEAYLASVGLKKPEPWCAAFICWIFAQEGFIKPKSGWTPDLFPKSRVSSAPLSGNIIGIYCLSKKRIAHVGIIEKMEGDWCLSIEGNTNVDGSREGDGVYKKRRHQKTIYRISDWISKGKGGT